MEHEGNTHTSAEEAAAVARLFDELLGDGDGDGDEARVMLREGTRLSHEPCPEPYPELKP